MVITKRVQNIARAIVHVDLYVLLDRSETKYFMAVVKKMVQSYIHASVLA